MKGPTLEFTREQREFLAHPRSQHARLLAGPGTGKSTTVIEYASELLQAGFSDVQLLTFTRAATAELADRLANVAEGAQRPSTIHSFAIALVLHNPGMADVPMPLRIMAEWEWDTLVRPRITRLMRLGRRWHDADQLRHEMAAKWESLSDTETVQVDAGTRARFVSEWQQHREFFGYTDLSEIPYLLYTGLRSHPDFDYGPLELLIVDEYQDLNACDLECLRLLRDRGVIIFAVGDDDQSIYHFRKAHPAGIRRFAQEYQAKSYPLTVTQRFGTNILAWANHVIAFDSGRDSQKPSIAPSSSNPIGRCAYLEFRGHASERRGIVQLVQWLHGSEGVPFEEILVLGRSRAVTAPILAELKTAGVQCADPDAVGSCFEHPAMREMMAMLRLVADREDSLAWWTLLALAPGVGHSCIDGLVQHARSRSERFGQAILRLQGEGQLQQIAGRSAAELVSRVVATLDVVTVPDDRPWGEWILERVAAQQLPQPPDPVATYFPEIDATLGQDVPLGSYISQIQPISKDLALRKTNGAVRVMTMTGSKGPREK